MVFRQTPEWHEEYKAKRARECAIADQRSTSGGAMCSVGPANITGVATGSRNGLASESDPSLTPSASAPCREREQNHDAKAAPIYQLVSLCRAAGIPEPTPEFTFHPTRKWRADYAWLSPLRLIVEIDGGVWSQGRHTRGAGFIKDMEKLNAAALLGFRVLRYAPHQLGQAMTDLRIMFAKEAA